MNDDGSGKKVLLLTLLVIIILIIYQLIFIPFRERSIFSEHRIVTGYFSTLEIDGFSKTKYSKYTYFIDSQQYVNELVTNLPCKNSDKKREITRNELLGMRFPIVVSNENYNFSKPLLRPKDWKMIGKPFPDSLNYMYEKYFDCTLWESFNAND